MISFLVDAPHLGVVGVVGSNPAAPIYNRSIKTSVIEPLLSDEGGFFIALTRA